MKNGETHPRREQERGPSAGAPTSSILEPGRNCWRCEPAKRAALMVDGADYFAALASAIERARRQILVIGWDVHSRVALLRDSEGRALEEFADLLDRCVRRRRELHVHVLGWDFAMIYALERESLPLLRFGMQTHGRVRFHLDDRHPLGGSHHQKIVVVDDGIGFCGGLDVTAARWDTSEHRADDPRRCLPDGSAYPPFHDVQMAVDAEAARALGDLARERWLRATGERLAAPEIAGDPWPPDLSPDLLDVRVAVARTQPAYDDAPEIREVESLHLDSCRSARRAIYVENQYLSSVRIADVLAERLHETDGPEVVIVTRKDWSGWLEGTTMEALRVRFVQRLQAADEHDRLRIYYPVVPDGPEQAVNLHSKLMVIDDRCLRVGSANLANRSMGLDSECDLAAEADGTEHAQAILRLRNRLLAEHLGTSPEEVAVAVERSGSLIGAIEALNGGARRLQPLEVHAPEWLDGHEAEIGLLDPERPIEFEELREQFLPEAELIRPARGRLLRLGALAAGLVILAGVWRFTPIGEWITAEGLSASGSDLRQSPLGPLIAFGVFVIAAVAMVPVTALIAAGGLIFGWKTGFAVGLGGSLGSAALGYAVGRRLWRDTVRRLAGRRLDQLSRWLGDRGVFSTMAVRVIPVAPFSIVNLVAGASHIRFRDFLLGTLLGMAPGTLLLVVFVEGAWDALRDPRPERVALLVGIGLIFVAAALTLRRLARRSG